MLNALRILSLKNKHKGKRGFVIGNGPSLSIKDLSLLKNDITFASNKIYLAFEQTDWRPTYYNVSDELVAKNNYKTIESLKLFKIFNRYLKKYFSRQKDILWVRHNGRFEFSNNLLKGIGGGWSVINDQLQIAFYMGISEVYLLGVDFDFTIPKKTAGKCASGKIIVSEGECNHFHKDYRKTGEEWTFPNLEMQRKFFLKAKKTFLADGRKILNASRRTKLDVFERIDLDAVFKMTDN
jgi:hypothetical protein